MIFVDTNVLMYAVGRPHPLRPEAQAFFELAMRESGRRLCTSVEVLQELMHAYLPVQRTATLDAALRLAYDRIPEIWPVELADFKLAHVLIERHPELGARDLLHRACCKRRGVVEVKTFDRALAAAFRC